MMSNSTACKGPETSSINRREAIVSTLTASAALATWPGAASEAGARAMELKVAGPLTGSPKSYRMKKSINLWAFPFPGA